MRKFIFAAVTITLSTPLAAQTSPQMKTDLIVTMTPQPHRICNDRPARPVWMDEIHPREAYKVLTLMRLYELRSWEAITASDNCGCDTRFPAWDAALAEYEERFASATQTEHTQARLALGEQQSQIAREVQELCEAQGNW